MTTPLDASLRARARVRYSGRCAYCGVELIEGDGAIDLHQPLRHGGAESDENAVYCCQRCNLYKGNYWHEVDPPRIRLLHPLRDALDAHLHEREEGVLVGDTPEGRFYIERLRLNRPSLVDLRRVRRLVARARALDEELRLRIEAAEHLE